MYNVDKMLKMEDLLEKFSVTRATVYQWIKNNGFPKPCKIGGQNFWEPSEIAAYLKSTRDAPERGDAS